MPEHSNDSASISFACFINALLFETGIGIHVCNTALRCPTKKCFPVIPHKEDVSDLAIVRDRMKGCKKLFSYDGANKGMHDVAKVVSRWHIDRMMNFLLDLDVAAGTSISTAEEIDTSFKKNLTVLLMTFQRK